MFEDFMIPSAEDLYGDVDFIFQQDLASAHTARSTKTWFDAHAITVLEWKANSLDLNPFENLWEKEGHQTPQHNSQAMPQADCNATSHRGSD